MNSVTAKYFSTDFFIANKIDAFTYILLEYMYSWILSDKPPKSFKINRKRYFYISQSHIAEDLTPILSQQIISSKMKKLKNCSIICDTLLIKQKGKINKFYICFDWNRVLQSLAPQAILKEQKYKFCSNWFEKIFNFIKEEEETVGNDELPEELSGEERLNFFLKEQNSYNKSGAGMSGLLDESDMRKKVYYCKQADAIARRILKKYAQYFSNRIPEENQEPSKTYVRLCRKIEDIYNGRFTSSRFYAFDEKVFKNKQFNTDGWREKINAVKGDWSKVKKLVFEAVDNFVLMYDENRMPLKKDYLVTSLNDWFFSENPNSRGQSQFIQSLNEPMLAKEKLGLDAAISIANDMKQKSPATYSSCHELNMLLPQNASEITAWKFMRKMMAWGKLFWQFESNAKYFMQGEIDGKLEAGPKVLPALFARYLKEKGINVTLGTLDIERAADSNAPWVWFIKDACNEHDMNSDYVYCFTDQDFYDAYQNENRGKITFDDMSEIVF